MFIIGEAVDSLHFSRHHFLSSFRKGNEFCDPILFFLYSEKEKNRVGVRRRLLRSAFAGERADEGIGPYKDSQKIRGIATPV